MSVSAMTPYQLASEVATLFTLPDVALRACTVMDRPNATAQDLIEIVGIDPNLALTVLKLANSVLYGSRGHIDTLARAIALIGHKALRDLVLATSAVKTFRGIPTEFVDMDTFWENSTTSGVFANLIANHIRMQEAETYFLAGLLHGVGRLIFYVRRPMEYREVLCKMQEEQMKLGDAETMVFGFNHAELGAALLESWHLPEILYIPIRHQLDPSSATCFHKEVALIHLAADMAANLAPCFKTHQEAKPYVPDEHATFSMQLLGLSHAELMEFRLEALAASLEVLEIIHPNVNVIY